MYLSIIILPLLGSIVSGFFGRKVGVDGAQIITCSSVIITTILAILAFAEVGFNNIPVTINLFRWIDSEWFNIIWGFQFDSLTVCFVGLLLLQQIEAVLVLIQLYKNIFIKKLFNYMLVSLALKSYTFKSLCINGSINKKLKLSSFPLHHSLSPLGPKWRVNSLNQIMSYSILSDVSPQRQGGGLLYSSAS